jgi:hypothetical protein
MTCSASLFFSETGCQNEGRRPARERCFRENLLSSLFERALLTYVDFYVVR